MNATAQHPIEATTALSLRTRRAGDSFGEFDFPIREIVHPFGDVSDHPKFPPCDHLKIPPSSEPREVWDGQQRENRDASRGA